MTVASQTTTIEQAPEMTPAEIRAFNNGIEAMRALARTHYAQRAAYRHRRSMIGGMMSAFRIVEEDGAKLIRDVPEEARRRAKRWRAA